MSAQSKSRIVVTTGKLSGADWFWHALATFGVGYFPIAPGTWGSAVGVGIFWGIDLGCRALFHNYLAQSAWIASDLAFRNAILLVVTLFLSLAGIHAASVVEQKSNLKDPHIVVVDEVAGQLIALLMLPAYFGRWSLLAGFLTFRLFDIWKPFPIKKLEALESGLGIMADDILAGIYSAVVVAVLVAFRFLS